MITIVSSMLVTLSVLIYLILTGDKEGAKSLKDLLKE